MLKQRISPGAFIAEVASQHGISASDGHIWRRDAGDDAALVRLDDVKEFVPVSLTKPAPAQDCVNI